MQTRTNNLVTHDKRSQLSKAILLDQNIRIAHRELKKELLREKGSFSEILSVKGYYQKLDFDGWSLHMTSACHHVRNQKYLLLAKNKEPMKIKIL